MASISASSETRDVVGPTLRALNSLPYCLAERLQSGRARGGKMRLCSAGCPDLFAIICGTTVFFEAKTPIGRLSPAQLEWHRRARNAGAFVQVIRSPREAIEVAKSLFGRLRT